MKQKVKIVVLEGETTLTNAELIAYMNQFVNSSAFAFTQKPRVQVAQAVRKEK